MNVNSFKINRLAEDMDILTDTLWDKIKAHPVTIAWLSSNSYPFPLLQ